MLLPTLAIFWDKEDARIAADVQKLNAEIYSRPRPTLATTRYELSVSIYSLNELVKQKIKGIKANKPGSAKDLTFLIQGRPAIARVAKGARRYKPELTSLGFDVRAFYQQLDSHDSVIRTLAKLRKGSSRCV